MAGAGRRAAGPATLLVAAVAIAALSLLVVAPAPSYDPWAWLLWGREIAGGELSTAEGPSFKPGAVIVTAPLALLGGAAPVAWVLIARTGAVLALVLAFRLGRRLAAGLLSDGDPRAAAEPGGARAVAAGAGLLAVAGVALSAGYAYYAASGMVTGWVLALGLAGAEAWRAGRPRAALACGVGCALLHVESWPFLAALGLLLWRRRARDRPLLALAAAAVPALWLVPELIGSGNLVRAAERAQVPNPGQPATADVPALASLGEAAAIPPWPLWLGLAALLLAAIHARRAGGAAARALAPAAAGAAWVAIVAAMSQLGGFSGEPRYAAPGMALIAISGAVGLAAAAHRLALARTFERSTLLCPPQSFEGPARRRGSGEVERLMGPRPARSCDRRRAAAAATALATVLLVFAVAAAPRVEQVRAVAASQSHQWQLASDLRDAVRAAGGRAAVLRCGTPYVGPLRGPLMAYRLDVPKHVVEPDLPPRPPGVVFQSRSRPGARAEPELPSGATASLGRAGRGGPRSPGFREVARDGRWRVLRSCQVRMP